MSKKNKSAKKVLTLKSGETFPIIRESGKYWICEGTQFRKSNPAILCIETVKAEKKPEESEAKSDNADQ